MHLQYCVDELKISISFLTLVKFTHTLCPGTLRESDKMFSKEKKVVRETRAFNQEWTHSYTIWWFLLLCASHVQSPWRLLQEVMWSSSMRQLHVPIKYLFTKVTSEPEPQPVAQTKSVSQSLCGTIWTLFDRFWPGSFCENVDWSQSLFFSPQRFLVWKNTVNLFENANILW